MDQPVRILYAHSSSLIGGGNKVLLDLFEGIDRSKFQPLSVIPTPGPLEEELRQRDVPYFIQNLYSNRRSRLELSTAVARFALKSLSWRIRILHANDPHIYYLASIGTRISRTLHVCYIHHPGESIDSLRWALKWFPRVIVTPSLFMKRQVAGCLEERFQSKVETLWNPIDTEWFSPAPDIPEVRARIGLEPHHKHVSILGALAPHKGHVCFLRMARNILLRFPETTFHIVGSTKTGCKEHADSLERLARELGVQDRVHFWGFVPDELARDILRASDLFVLPTTEEGFGLSVAEAQSCAVSVLTSSIPPLDEVVDDGCTGYLLDPWDPEQFTARAIALLEADDTRKKMGLAARKWVLDRFSKEVYTRQMMSLYQGLLAS